MLAALKIDTEVSEAVVALGAWVFVAIWLGLVWWTNTDARQRIDDTTLIRYVTAVALFPFLGTVIYLIIRPAESLEDIRERETSIAASEKLLAVLTELQQTQREMHGSIERLEGALQASRRRAASRAREPRS